MSNIKVSVIVPVYNVEEYLPKCLDSIVNQTLKDIEILVINDGTPDNSQAIIDEYANKYPKLIKPFIKENGGLSDARNYGIERAQGEYLAFVDSDDYICTDMLEKLYNRAKETDADVVSSPMAVYNGTVVTKRTYSAKEHLFGKSVSESPKCADIASSYACNKLYRKDFWIENGFKFPKGQYFEDSALVYNVMFKANKVEYVNRAFYNYIKNRPGAITNSFDDRVFDLFKSFDSILVTYGKSKNPEVLDVMANIFAKHTFVRINELFEGASRKLTARFIDKAYEYLDSKVPAWRECSYVSIEKSHGMIDRIIRIIRNKKAFAKLFYTMPLWMRKFAMFMLDTMKKLYHFLNRKEEEAAKLKLENKKRKAIQSFGLPLIEYVQKILKEHNICAFADFGTMLGIIREGRLLAHDLDIDIGVILNEDFDIQRIHDAMENNGFKLWRQYINGEQVVEESYKLNDLKVDFNFYRITNEYSKTWLFYQKPGYKYKEKDKRHVVEMTYSPIKEMQTVTVKGHNIIIPANAEQLLEEKYGKTWRTPDKGWIYWQSPAATPLDDIDGFISYRYPNYTFVNEEWFTLCNKKPLATIKRLQEIELDIVLEVDRICKEHNITYYLGEGTLLGAMRHHGFIPWDDDVDIIMPMKDYKKFLQVAPEAINEKYKVQHSSLQDNYQSIFAKVRLLDNSEFFQHSLEGITDENGPYIDIFPLNTVKEHSLDKCKKSKKMLSDCRKAISYNIGDTRPKTIRTKLFYLTVKNKSVTALHKQVDEIFNSLEEADGTSYANYASYYSIAKQIYPISYYGQPRYVEFEGKRLPVPQKAEEILFTIYGPNWHRMPKYSLRKAKHSISHRNADGTAEEMEII